ncbi:MAG: SDR family NAD(P)-dependent oxidoreductase [Gammaproteobacteria bacterium]|nr:SDR family NAD(P)-dependent oxidoreductase [Gammaproteobacteria bacterium]
MGAIATVDAAAAFFMSQRRGHIVAIASVAAKVAVPRQAAYCASKAGLAHYMDAARIELSRHGITVGTLLPGFVVTDIMPTRCPPPSGADSADDRDGFHERPHRHPRGEVQRMQRAARDPRQQYGARAIETYQHL